MTTFNKIARHAAPPSDETVAGALARYFVENGFGEGGGYDDDWVGLGAGAIGFPFPNSAPRQKAVRYHDLHHLVTGYRTDPAGEFEISAWEVGSGCRDYGAAWHLNLSGMGAGLLICPRRTFRAFRRGRRSRNFYGEDYSALLTLSVAEARRECFTDRAAPRTTVADVALFAAAELVGLVVALSTLVVATPLALV